VEEMEDQLESLLSLESFDPNDAALLIIKIEQGKKLIETLKNLRTHLFPEGIKEA
jgi:hypothetical protein